MMYIKYVHSMTIDSSHLSKNRDFIHPLSIPPIPVRALSGWMLFQHSLRERQGAPWTSCQSVIELTRTDSHSHSRQCQVFS